jgi:hypothetical protein
MLKEQRKTAVNYFKNDFKGTKVVTVPTALSSKYEQQVLYKNLVYIIYLPSPIELVHHGHMMGAS